MPKNEDWKNLADHLRAARGERSLREVAVDCLCIEGSILNLELARPPRYGRPAVLYRLVEYYGWTRESVEDMLAGRSPTPLGDEGESMNARK